MRLCVNYYKNVLPTPQRVHAAELNVAILGALTLIKFKKISLLLSEITCGDSFRVIDSMTTNRETNIQLKYIFRVFNSTACLYF